MNKLKSLVFLSLIGMAISATPILKSSLSSRDDGGVFICEDTGEKGPIFYPADLSPAITSEPSYSTQNTYTFSSMNFVNTPKVYRGDSVKVAVIDSGLNYIHEDFKLNGNQIIQGHSRTIDNQSGSWLYYQFDAGYQSRINDTLGHGTNVASVIASQINALGCAGIAPNVELYVYKVTNTSNGYEWTAINSALSYCVSEGIDVINMSFQAYEHAVTYNGSTMNASTGCSSVMTNYINSCYNAGITLVAAAGNYNTSEPSYPASNNHVISVGSLAESSTTTKAGYSNTYGIDLVAPGTVYVADKGTNSSYKKTQGTSFSAPIVTAAIALYKQTHPSATPAQIESALYASCDSISGNPSWAGNGRLNIDKFLGVETSDGPTEIIINNPEIENDDLSLEVGDTLDLDLTVNGIGTFDDSVSFELLYDNGTVSVDNNGRIIALSEGTDAVWITCDADQSVEAVVYVTVTSSGGSTPTVSSVTVSPSALNLDLNGTKTGNLTATVSGTNSPAQTVTWTSSNSSVATVSNSGVVTAKATGSATITATSTVDNTKSGTCSVTVSDSTIHVTSVSLNKNSTSIAVGGDETLTATVLPNNATDKSVTWTSSNTSVATVSDGKVTAVSAGNATITVSTVDGNRTATCTVTVTAPTTYTLTITRNSFSTSGGYAWYDWSSQSTYNSTSVSGKGELYTTEKASMQFNKSKGNEVAAIYNTTAIPGSITKIEATTASGTNRSWNAYVTSTACSSSGSTLTFGSNKTTVGSNITVTTSSTAFGTSSLGYSYFCIQENVTGASYISEFKITFVPKSLSSIAVKTAPTKTTYEEGDNFDPTGLVITATYSDSTTSDIAYSGNESSFTFNPTTTTSLTSGTSSVTITYGGKSTTQAISVSAAKTLSSITISGYTTSFVEGDTFSFGGTVTAHWSDSTTSNVTASSTFSGYTMTNTGNQNVTVSYTYKGSEKTASYSITISQGTLSSIAVSGQTTSFIKNKPFNFDGTCIASFENGYQKDVAPTSVSSPNMSTAGNKTVTVSYTYNGKTVTTTYDITVASGRTVIETQTSNKTSTITWPESATPSITGELTNVSCSVSGKTQYESSSMRLGTSKGGGTLSISSSNSINKVDVVAKYYSNSYSSAVLKVDGQSVTPLSSDYSTFTVTLGSAKTSFTVLTENSNSRVNIQSITLYSTTTVQTDISDSEDCVGLEDFIDTYLHLDYVDNLGYCKDNEHHYYSTAKTAFNALNAHQRNLFTSNSAYLTEWTRLSTWASKNGDSLNVSNELSSIHIVSPIEELTDMNLSSIVAIAVCAGGISLCLYLFIRRKKIENKKH